jgi:DNA-binding winged helix-turn-helix (wHTH) protein
MSTREIFRFGGFTLDVGEHRLSAGPGAVRLSPKAFDVLVALVRQRGRLIRKDELLAQVWPESFVEEGILTVHVSALRKALGDDTRPPAYIETVARTGYRFISAVTCDSAADEQSALAALARPVELYEYVGHGRSHLLSGSYFELPSAVDAFRAAIAIDSTYAPAHAGLARARCAQAALRAVPHQDAFTEAKASALRALAMDSTSADAQVALGTVLFLSEWDWSAAERSLRRALEINPDHTEALLQLGSLQDAVGRPDEGVRLKEQALARDPRSALVLVQIAISYWNQRKYVETVAWAQRALDIDPRHLLAREFIAGVYWKLGDVERFIAENLKQAKVFGVPDEAFADLQRVTTEMQEIYSRAGLPALTRYMADRITDQRLDLDAMLKMAVRRAVLYGAAGRLDDAFEALDQAIAHRDPALVHLGVAPQWDSLRADYRFADRLKDLALPCSA